jgi:nucleoside-diphosphate-sugar epimerase
MWLGALAAHRAGDIRATEARGSDYLGHGSQSQLGPQALAALRKGKTVWVLGDPDVIHTWTYTGDMARTLVAAATDPKGWGRPWHVPSHEARTLRQVVADLAAVEGVKMVPVRRISPGLLRAGSLVVPILRELPEVDHQHTRPWVMDSSAAQEILGVKPTPWDDILRNHLGSAEA